MRYIGIFVIGIVVGTGASFTYYSIQGEHIYQAGFDAAKNRVLASSLCIRTPNEVFTLSGVVTSLRGTTLTLAVRSIDPFSDPSLDERSVTIDTMTKVTLLAHKNPATFNNEMGAFQTTIQGVKSSATSSPSSLPTPPQLFDRKAGDSSSLKAGQVVNITSAENIKDQKNFVARTIDILPALISPAPSSPVRQ